MPKITIIYDIAKLSINVDWTMFLVKNNSVLPHERIKLDHTFIIITKNDEI